MGVNMERVVKKKASIAEMEPVRVAGPQDEGKESPNSFTGNNKDLRTYFHCYSKPLKRVLSREVM